MPYPSLERWSPATSLADRRFRTRPCAAVRSTAAAWRSLQVRMPSVVLLLPFARPAALSNANPVCEVVVVAALQLPRAIHNSPCACYIPFGAAGHQRPASLTADSVLGRALLCGLLRRPGEASNDYGLSARPPAITAYTIDLCGPCRSCCGVHWPRTTRIPYSAVRCCATCRAGLAKSLKYVCLLSSLSYRLPVPLLCLTLTPSVKRLWTQWPPSSYLGLPNNLCRLKP